MTAVAVVLLIVAAAAVFAIAAVVVGREAHRLDARAPRTIYTLDDAIAYVADHVPADSQARLTHDEVEQLLRLHLRRLHDKGLLPVQPLDQLQDIDIPV